jgi:hypothetical protein
MATSTALPHLNQRQWSAKLLLVVCSLAILACCIAAGYTWQQRLENNRWLQGLLTESSTSAAWIEQQLRDATSREGTVVWSQLVTLVGYHPATAGLANQVPIVGEGALPSFGPGEEPTWPNIDATAAYLAEMQPVIELLRQARDVEMPVWIEMNFMGLQTPLPELQATRNISRLARLEHLYALYTGDTDRALDALRSLDAIPQAFDWHLFLVGELVHTALRGVVYDAVKESLKAGRWSDEQLAELQQMVVEPLEISRRWKQTLMYERTLVFQATPVATASVAGAYNLVIAPEDRLALFESYQAAMELGNFPLEELVSRANALERRAVEKAQLERRSPVYKALLTSIFPAMTSLADALVRLETQRQVTAVAVAIKRFEVANNRWPQDLSELQSSAHNPGEWFESWTAPDSNWEYSTTETVASLRWHIASEAGMNGPDQEQGGHAQVADWLQATIARDASARDTSARDASADSPTSADLEPF